MRKTTLFKLIAVVACLSLLLVGCSGTTEEEETTDLNSYTLDEIIEKAQEEGHVESVGMPDSWANWGESWTGLTETYGIEHTDEDMSSAEELNMFANDSTRDIGDVGLAFTSQAIEEGLVQSYKTSYWDSVPDWAKDDEGLWMIAYTGCTAFIYNNDITTDPAPTSWADVKTGTYKLTIGDVVGGATGQGVVVATAYAFGGDLDNLQPAYDFWTEMAEAGRIDSGDILLARIQAGEVELGVSWSYNVLTYRDQTPNYNFTVGIPSDGAILVGYASIINSKADSPFAAALAREYIFSDQGQINLAKSGAVPTRTDVEIPQEIQDSTFQASEYANAVGISDAAQYASVCSEISTWWNENIIPLMG
ncbi:MAG TPA: ABC transporter substrate-binding protein [Oscillospiraceae bacterium]|nr:ABC transporter substrate-binding protein [Oscillospiraceae bacterium]